MNNRIGLGVFGTFGDPHGYQQEFYSNVRFVNSLDLNEFAIEFYPGADLYSVKREIIDGVYTVCFCIYTYARELNTERFGTFIGACIVLQDSFTDADYIYQSLKELHKSILSNNEYLKDNTINVATVKDIAVTEPSEFVAARANAIPISKTPFFTPYVDPQKNYLVLPDATTNASLDEQLLQFFEEAQKYHTDTTTLYFSTDSNVADFVKQEEILEIQDWQTFCSRKQEALKTAVVRTKKGVYKPATFNEDTTLATSANTSETSADYSATSSYTPLTAAPVATEPVIDAAHQAYLPKSSDSYLTEDDDDPYKPFDLWDEPIPETGWNKQETTYRVKEYNRLFRYTNILLEHIHQPSANDTEGMPKKKKLLIALLVILLLTVAVVVYIMFFHNKPNNNPPKFQSGNKTEKNIDTTTSKTTESKPSTPDPEPDDESDKEVKKESKKETEIDAPKPVEKVATTTKTQNEPTTAKENKTTTITPSTAIENAETGVNAMYIPGKEVPSSNSSVSMIPGDLKPKTLHPRPNTQLSQNDIPSLKESGVKDKTLTEIVKILFENSPQNIGYIYKGQEQQYGALLLTSNKIFFKRATNDYICTADQQPLHIPAYKSPRLPAVFPK